MNEAPIALAGSLDQYAAPAIKDQLLPLLHQADSLRLDFTKVEHIDLSVLQILLALKAGLSPGNRRVSIAGARESVKQWFVIAGAAEQFEFLDGEN